MNEMSAGRDGSMVTPAPVTNPLSAMRPRSTSAEIALVGIYEISKILTEPRRLEVTLASVVNVLSSMLQMRRGMIVVLDDEGDPDIVATTGWTPRSSGEFRSRVPQKAVDQIVATAMPLVIHDVAHHTLFAGTEGIGDDAETSKVSFIGVPVKADHRVIGTLSIDRTWDGSTQFRFDEDVRFLTMVANLVGQTIRLYRLVAEDRDRLITEQHRLQKALSSGGAKSAGPADLRQTGILGSSPVMQRLLKTARTVARSNSTVLLRGESGTGKELFARAIHELSARKGKPFVKLNCAALPETMLESELFGHEKGSFTGALSQRLGRFEIANGGTLFLDEIGEISPAFQAKLLRVLQEGEFERVGGNRTIKVDVRLIAATNRNLEEAVTKGEFRSDLYYRISVVPLLLPPLRERTGDIPQLANAFLKRFNDENHRSMTFSPSAVEVLMKCYFPGNVRELENCVRRTATLAHHEMIEPNDFACANDQCLSATLWKGSGPRSQLLPVLDLRTVRGAAAPVAPTVAAAESPPPEAAMAEPASACGGAPASLAQAGPAQAGPVSATQPTEKDRLVQAMETSGWVQAKAARILGLTPRQIGYALKKHGVDIKRF